MHITELKADTRFRDMDPREQAERRGIDLIATLPPVNNKEGCFPKDGFEINLEEMCARCPAGQVTHKTRRAEDHKARRVQLFVFDEAACSACPMGDKCVRANKPRTVGLGYYEKKHAQVKSRQSTVQFERERSYVERLMVWLTRHGARQARYIGRGKTRFQLQITAGVSNILALYRKLAEKTKLAEATRDKCPPAWKLQDIG